MKKERSTMARRPREKIKLSQTAIKTGFDTEMIKLSLDDIVALKVIPPLLLKSPKFQQILVSIREVGLIEPLVVCRDKNLKDRYFLLDGHLRLVALKELGVTEVMCLVSTDDESFTYNKHINRLSPIQEHRMILRAVERGVSIEKIASALNIEVKSITRKRNLLEGICPEAVELLKDKLVAANVFTILRRLLPLRQIEAATLMNDADIHSESFAKAIFAATPKDQLVEPEKPKKIKGITDEEMARMESEMEGLQREYRLVEEGYGRDALHLTLAKGYLGALLGNARIVRYLAQKHAGILAAFQKIVDLTSLKEAAA
jgi:ParB-like chromosome segregation protein Spo0J